MKTLLFDAGGTLVHPNWGLISRILRENGVDVTGEAMERGEPEAHFRLDTPDHFQGTTDRSRWTVYFTEILKECGIADVPKAALDALGRHHEFENLWNEPVSDASCALKALQHRRKIVVSNSNGTVETKLKEIGMAHHFEAIFDSHNLGVEKPDPRIFEIVLRNLGVEPGDAIYVGDLYQVDVVGARAAGMDVYLLDPRGRYEGRDCRRVASLTEFARAVAQI